MGKGNLKSRIRKREVRREKLHKLRQKYQQARADSEKQKIIEKALKIAPWLKKEEFLISLKSEK